MRRCPTCQGRGLIEPVPRRPKNLRGLSNEAVLRLQVAADKVIANETARLAVVDETFREALNLGIDVDMEVERRG